FEYDMKQVLARLFDASTFNEFRAGYGPSLLCGDAHIGGIPVGIVTNQRQRIEYQGEVRVGGVIYPEAADKAARFIKRCAQQKRPLLFIQDVSGFMVGKQAEESGIIKRGASMVHAISNAEVPKITLIVGRSNGAGNYAMCGRAFKPDYIAAWPGAEIGVMGGTQATETLFSLKKDPESMDPEQVEREKQALREEYEDTMNPRYAASRMWVDDVLDPAETPAKLARVLQYLTVMPEPQSSFGNL
ncbi:MAG: carboxyl transferase domain-containing protein, partial [bacterium]